MILTKSEEEKAQQFTDLVFREDIESSTKRAKKEIKEILFSLREGKSIFRYNGQIVTSLPCDFPRILVEWNRSSDVDQSIRHIILSSLLSSEEKVSGSALFLAGLWCSEEFSEKIPKRSRSKYKDVQKCLDYLGSFGMSRAAAESVINLGGLGHKVNYVESSERVTKVESVVGKEIFGSVDPLFGDKAGRNHKLESAVSIAIDGSVESLGSIYKILEELGSTSVVLIANSFLPDVSNSLAETFIQNRGKCIPFKAENWNSTNFLDLEKSGIICVSNERGDTVSGISLKNVKQSSVIVSENKVILESENVYDRSDIIVSVSKTLGGLTGVAIDRIKSLVGYSRLAARGGVVRWEDLKENFSRISDLYSENLVMPLHSLEGGLRGVKSLRSILQEVSCLVIVKKGVKK